MTSDTGSSVAGVICAGVMLITLVLPTFLLSRLLKVEHDEFHDQWVKDGRPSGMPFWLPSKELHLMDLSSYSGLVGTWWLFKTPDWVRGHQTASKLLRYYRLVSYTLYLGLFGACVLVLIAAPR
jgi:hypothetical protein